MRAFFESGGAAMIEASRRQPPGAIAMPSQRSEYLYRIQPTRLAMLHDGPTPDEARTIERHFHYLRSLTARGVVVLAGRTLNTDGSSFGIVTFYAESEVAARAIVDGDPAVQAGVMRAELFPYRIALMAPTEGVL
jgi:uncharacterized protein